MKAVVYGMFVLAGLFEAAILLYVAFDLFAGETLLQAVTLAGLAVCLAMNVVAARVVARAIERHQGEREQIREPVVVRR